MVVCGWIQKSTLPCGWQRAFVCFGRNEATRTPDPYVPNVVRYQLRYIPILNLWCKCRANISIEERNQGKNEKTFGGIDERCVLCLGKKGFSGGILPF